jgi:hypothetical protein
MALLDQHWYDVGLIGVGMPPSVRDQEPLGLIDGLIVVGVLVLAFWWSVRLVAWIDVKLSSRQLFREIYREYRKHRPKPRGPGDPRRSD